MPTDVITQEVIRARLDGIVREMQAAVLRTGYSTIIRESHDFSAGITDRDGNVVGQYSPFPVHLGAYPYCIQGVRQFYSLEEMEEGDCFLISHPYYSGCPHPNDMVVVTPVIRDGEVIAFCASMGHKPDIGAQNPGSRSAISRDVFGDGLQIMPVRFQAKREPVREVIQFLKANSRTPELVLGDLEAQAGALWSIGVARLQDLLDAYGVEPITDAFRGMGARTEARVRKHIQEWPDGTAEAEAFMDDIANPTEKIRVHVQVSKEGDRLFLDFSGCGDQSAGPINIRPPFIHGMSYYAAIAMMDPTIPNNYGLGNAMEFRFREGSIVNPSFPGPTGFYSMTLPMVEDVLLEALSKLAGRPAVAHNSPSGMVVIGTTGQGGRRYVQYEIMVSGNGAHLGGDGFTGTGHSWSGGAKFASVEILESEFAVDMECFSLVPDSGGAGEYRGGLAMRREYRVRVPSQFAGGSSRTLVPPQGVEGGASGRAGVVVIDPDTADAREHVGIVSSIAVGAGGLIRWESASAAGAGDPKDRPKERIVSDLRNGYISAETARTVYGLAHEEIERALAIPGSK